MNILLLGGSNAGVKDGWAVQFAQMAREHRVENRFLGAVGSLYGLMTLLKLEREGGALPDLVIFEYCLNDILLVDAGVLGKALIRDALGAVMDFCARKGVGLLLLCLEPRPIDAKPRKAVRKTQKLYGAAARRRGVACLWLRDVFPDALTLAHFQDENHLSTKAAGTVARALLAQIRRGVAAPASRGEEASLFDYVDATQARAEGPCMLRGLTSRVFEGPFLEISRGGRSLWPGEGRLAALMLRSSDQSGIYSIRSGGTAFRKTPRSRMQEVVRNLMLLHYVPGDVGVRREVEIAMPEDESRLMSLPANRGILEAAPTAPFDAQTLDIHGAMFWRKRSALSRLRAFLRLARF